MWDQVRRLHGHHSDVALEIRLLKLTEEVGEVAEAFIGLKGLNPRKGVCRSRDVLAPSWLAPGPPRRRASCERARHVCESH